MKKCAIITGASRGIGAGIAEKLASEKWNLALCARQKVEDGSKLAAALQEKYGNDKQRYNEELQKLYEKENVSPFSGCLRCFWHGGCTGQDVYRPGIIQGCDR